jgi:hypothetical protein
MKRHIFSVGLAAAAALSLTVGSAWAQDRGRPQGEQQSSRPSNGDTVGSAVPRGGGGDGGSSAPAPSSSSGGGSSSTAGGGSSNAGSSSSPAPWVGAPVRERAPMRPERAEAAEQRRRGGSGSTGQAVPRGEAGGRNAGSTGSTSATSGSDNAPAQGRSRAVPTYSRPRDGRNAVGTAVERTTAIPNRNPRGGYYYDPYYSLYYDPYYTGRYSYWSPFGYGYGLGYFSYDPFLFSGYGYPGAYGYDPYGGYDPAYGGGGYSSGYGTRAYRGSGSIRLKVKPANAQVYVDGYYVGVIDSFDGVFQRLSVDAGPHKVELKADGFDPVEFEVMVTPNDTVTYKGEMKAR